MSTPNDTKDYDRRYQDQVSAEKLQASLERGPMFYNVSTPFRTPRNADLTKWLEGENGVAWWSTDGGNWWFAVDYHPRKIECRTNYGFRLNQADPWIHRGAIHPVARMIYPGKASVVWDDQTVVQPALGLYNFKLLSVKETLDSGYTIEKTLLASPTNVSGDFLSIPSFPHGQSSFVFPHPWRFKPPDPVDPGPAPTEGPMVAWQQAKNAYDLAVVAVASYSSWKLQTPLRAIVRFGRVHRLLSVVRAGLNVDGHPLFVHVGLAPFYNNGYFTGWAAVKEIGNGLAWGTGILSELVSWRSDYGSWVTILHEQFNPNLDPLTQGPF